MNRKIVLAVVIVFILLIVISGGVTLYRWNKPLGPGLSLPTYPATLAPTAAPEVAAATLPANPEAASIPTITTSVPGNLVPTFSAPISTPKAPLCGGPSSMTILAIGSDQRGTSYLYGLADSIYAINIDFVTPKVMIIDFPRDLWVEIPGIADHYGITHGKINQAYLFGNPGMGYYDGPGEGPGLLALTLYQNFGLRVDHYLALDMKTLQDVVDAVGGIDVNTDKAVDFSYGNDPLDPKYYLVKGLNHINGEQAVALATNRIPTTFQRMKYQRIVANALREKLLSPAILPKIPRLVSSFLGSVRTDLSLADINKLICIAKAVPQDNIQADSFPQEMFTENMTFDQYRNLTTYTLSADFDQIRRMLVDFMNGVWPFPEDTPGGN